MDGWWECERLDVFFQKVLSAELDKKLPHHLKDTLRMFPANFASTLNENQHLLSDRMEGPNIANVFKRTFYQIMFKFQLGKSERSAGCALALPQSVWDSWKRHLADPRLEPQKDGTYDLFKPGQRRPSHVPAWVYIFELNTDTKQAPDPIEVKAIIATDAPSFSYYALEAVTLPLWCPHS